MIGMIAYFFRFSNCTQRIMNGIRQTLHERAANNASEFSEEEESWDESEKQQTTTTKSKNICPVGLQIGLPSFNFLMVMFCFIWFCMATYNLIPHVEEDLVGGIRSVFSDATLFLDNAVEQIDHLTDDNFEEFTDQFFAVTAGEVDEAGRNVSNEYGYTSVEEIMLYLNDTLSDYISEDQPHFLESLKVAKKSLVNLEIALSVFQENGAWEKLQPDTLFCDSWDDFASNNNERFMTCSGLLLAKDDIKAVDDNVFDDSISAIEDSEMLSNVMSPLANLVDQTLEGYNMLCNLSDNVELDGLLNIIDEIRLKIDSISDVLRGGFFNWEGFLNTTIQEPDGLDGLLNIFENFASIARYPILCGPAILIPYILLLLIGCIILACKIQKDALRKCGATMLLAGKVMFFVAAFFLGILAVACFIFGGSIQRIACFTLEMKDTEMTDPLDREVDCLIKNAFDDPTYTANASFSWESIIRDLQNETLSFYDVFQLGLILEEYIDDLHDEEEQFDNATEVIRHDLDIVVNETVEFITWNRKDEKTIKKVSHIAFYLEKAIEYIPEGEFIDATVIDPIDATLKAMAVFGNVTSRTTTTTTTTSTTTTSTTTTTTTTTPEREYFHLHQQTGMEAIEGLRFLASFGPPGTGKRKGGEKKQPFNRFHSHPGINNTTDST